jgi:SDR family mycofactocin-dependent oxidoreductase
MGKLEGRVAFITGAARGQGRSHAMHLAREGSDIIAVDICRQIPSVSYPLATPEDLAVTTSEVESLGRRISSHQVDVRDAAGLQEAFDIGSAAIGPADIVIANAGICCLAGDQTPSVWRDTIEINLTGVFNAVEVAIPSMVEKGIGGSIVLISSTAGLVGNATSSPGAMAYAASKHGVVGLMRSYANNLAPHRIRVNSIHPTGVDTPMVDNATMAEFREQLAGSSKSWTNALPVELLAPADISHAIEWLVSDAARYVTGITLSVDAGFVNKV